MKFVTNRSFLLFIVVAILASFLIQIATSTRTGASKNSYLRIHPTKRDHPSDVQKYLNGLKRRLPLRPVLSPYLNKILPKRHEAQIWLAETENAKATGSKATMKWNASGRKRSSVFDKKKNPFRSD
jgi:hypothetical protein